MALAGEIATSLWVVAAGEKSDLDAPTCQKPVWRVWINPAGCEIATLGIISLGEWLKLHHLGPWS